MISRFCIGNVARNMTEARLRELFVARGLRVTRATCALTYAYAARAICADWRKLDMGSGHVRVFE